MKIHAIVAMDDHNKIGFEGSMPWNIPEELKHFRDTTMGGSVIFGRATYESIGKPLEGRQTIVLTRDKTYGAEGVTVAHSIEEAIAAATQENVFIAGGASVYEQALPLCDELVLTRVAALFNGDKYFPNYFKWFDEILSRTEHMSAQGIPYEIRRVKRIGS